MDPETGNKCWGTVQFKNKLAPQILCNDVQINCTQEYNTVPFPLAIDNCDPLVQVELANQSIEDDLLCEEGYVSIIRTFTGFDQYGNEATPCTRPLPLCGPIRSISRMISSGNATSLPNIPILPMEPRIPGICRPPDRAFRTDWTGSIANTAMSLPTRSWMPAARLLKIVRTWTVLDWCTGQVVTFSQNEDNVQVIMVLDTTPPVITLAPFSVNANLTGVHPQPCKSTGFLQPAEVSDNCNTWTVRIFTRPAKPNM